MAPGRKHHAAGSGRLKEAGSPWRAAARSYHEGSARPGIPEAPVKLPPGPTMRIRPATPADALPMAQVYVAAWQDTYRGILPQAYLETMTVEGSAGALVREMRGAGVHSLVAESAAGRVVGLLTGGIDRRRDRIYRAEIFSLYVLRAFRGRGFGRELVRRFIAGANRQGIFTLKVQVLAANPHRRFYEKQNGLLLACGPITFQRAVLQACTYGWLDTDLVGEAI